ncbi:MAG: hypothetical protein PHX51_05145 [Clostridia bacterium]|nr:hypothetical protein [Clostridia bacterium]
MSELTILLQHLRKLEADIGLTICTVVGIGNYVITLATGWNSRGLVGRVNVGNYEKVTLATFAPIEV